MWRGGSLAAVVAGSTLIAIVAASYVSSEDGDVSSPERREAEMTRERAYGILRDSIITYRRNTHGSDQRFEDFLKKEWPQDFEHYTSGLRSYDEWKRMFDETV